MSVDIPHVIILLDFKLFLNADFFCTIYGFNFFSSFCFKMFALQILFLKEDFIMERLVNMKIEMNRIYTYRSILFCFIFFPLKRLLF